MSACNESGEGTQVPEVGKGGKGGMCPFAQSRVLQAMVRKGPRAATKPRVWDAGGSFPESGQESLRRARG